MAGGGARGASAENEGGEGGGSAHKGGARRGKGQGW